MHLGLVRKQQRDLTAAAALYQRAIDSGQPESAITAAVALGDLRLEQGDLTAAAALYQRAIDSGHPMWAPRAANNLGVLRKKQGDAAGAAAAYQIAIDSGHSEIASMAAKNLTQLEKSPGRRELRPARGSRSGRLLTCGSDYVEICYFCPRCGLVRGRAVGGAVDRPPGCAFDVGVLTVAGAT